MPVPIYPYRKHRPHLLKGGGVDLHRDTRVLAVHLPPSVAARGLRALTSCRQDMKVRCLVTTGAKVQYRDLTWHGKWCGVHDLHDLPSWQLLVSYQFATLHCT